MANDKDIRYTVTAEDRFSRTFAQLKRDLKDGGEQLAGITRLAGSAGGALAGIGASLAGGGSFLMFKQLANDLDALNDASDAVGDSIENLSALEDVARRNGEGLELVTTAALKLNKALAEAKEDSPMSRALDGIGLSAADLRRLDPSDAIRQVAVALQGYENDGRRAAIVQEIFGKSTKQVAAFLKDVAEAGDLNATVTAAQAAEAERFNKQLFGMQTNLSNMAREMAGPVLSALNQMFDAIEGRGVGGDSPITQGLVVPLQALSVLAANVSFVLKGIGTELGGIAAQGAALARGDFTGAAAIGKEMKAAAKAAREAFDLREQNLMMIGRVLPRADYSNEGRNRGAALRRAPSLADRPDKAAKQSASEAERYLERLQKEAEKLQDLTLVQQLLRDIEQKRIDGITPKLREKLFLEASSIDALKSQRKEIEAQQQAMDDLVDSVSRRADELDRILQATPTGRTKAIERQVDIVLRYARANPEDEAVQRQALEAVQQLRKEFDSLVEPPKEVAKEVEKMQLTIDRFAEKSIDAFVDFAATGKLSTSSLFDSFKRDVLRALIEDPVRDSMKNVVNIIKTELGKAGEGEGLLGGLFKSINSGGSSSGGGGWADIFAKLFSGNGGGDGYMGRANGGPVRAGQLVRWQEGGKEWFVPGQDGTVLNQAQMRGASGAGLQQVNTFNINGGDTATMRAELRAALDERDARLMRSLRNGRAAAYVGG